MDKNINVRVVGLPISQYDKEWLDTLNDEELSETACADGFSLIYGDLKEFQEALNLSGGVDIVSDYWIYFLTDLA
jgi:hypothetical protein